MRMRTVEISVGAFMLAGILSLIFLAVQVSGITLSSGGLDLHHLCPFR